VRARSLILVAAVLAVFVVLGGALYAYDHAQANEIAKGVRVAGVPLGGLTREQARARLQREVLDPLRRPIVVHHDTKTWELGAREARIRTDLDAMVDEAVARSQSGDVFSRSWRSLTGETLDKDLRPTVQYSDAAIVRMIDKVRKSIERDARDATVKIDGSGIAKVSSEQGLAVEASDLHRRIRAAIVSPSAKRTFVAHTRRVEPQVTTADLKRKYNTVIIVDRGAYTLRLYKDLELAQTFPIAVGQVGLETPEGLYNVQNKAVNPAWHVPNSDWAGDLAGQVIPAGDPGNPIKARWLGIFDGAGIHGTSDDGSIGTAASHGCIRMHIPDVIELYDETPLGAPVYIA
jgi:lipoprotein-anchoring transpeptidase ErfK/SrfK